jgi:formyltetrahydrofolate synthetase
MKNSLEIAQDAELQPIQEIGERIGLEPDEIEPYGRYKSKISLTAIDRLADQPDGKLVCVTGMTPTKAGEGKTTTSVALTEGMGYIGRKPVLCLREPSLGPVFGMKGGAAGGGFAQVVPMEDLNLHFTGDIHAVGAANNLLAAILDASILHGNPHRVDALRVTWKRAVDMNDRALRHVALGLGGSANGYPRETGFDITAASEVMAILAVARDIHDLRRRLGRITVAYTRAGDPVTAEDLGAAGAMTVLLKDAIKPNLIQTLEGQPCLMHAGPFANIAHGNSSLIADLLGLKLGEYVITESGFGSDMGMEKFIDIVCRAGGIAPDAIVVVATVRALKHHGGLADDDPRASHQQRLAAIEAGIANLSRHLEIVREFGLPAVVAVNRRPEDTDEEVELVTRAAEEAGAFAAAVSDGFAQGGKGVADLAEAVVAACDQPSEFRFLYDNGIPTKDKIEIIADRVYGASEVVYYLEAEHRIEQFAEQGLAELPVCMAKTPLSLSADPELLGAPSGFQLPVRDIRAYTGAGWLVPLCGDIQQMPGLGKTAAAFAVDIDAEGRTVGLF